MSQNCKYQKEDNFHTLDPEIIEATLKNVVTKASWLPVFVDTGRRF